MDWPFGELRPFSFGLLMVDPPWAFENYSDKGEAKNAKAHYRCIPTDELVRWPVGHLAGGDCWIWLWATHPMLPDALRCMSAWGFKFVTSGTWAKRGHSGKLAFGPGYVLRTCSEPFLIGKVGEPRTFDKSVRTIIEAPRRRHSEKPAEAYKICERLFGDVPRAEIFSRTDRPGWVSFGDQAGVYNEPAIHSG